MSRIIKLLCLTCILKVSAASSATIESSHDFFTFTFENDVFVGSDDGYTNGTGITFGQTGFDEFTTGNTPRWIHLLIKDLPINTETGKKRGISHMFFQRMQTPTEITETAFIPDDLPYAGLLAWQGTAYSWDDDVAKQLSLFLGWVGPATLAEQSQKFIHKIVGADEPQGWDYQLDNEPVFKIELQRVWSLYRNTKSRYQFDVLGLAGAGVGNLLSAAKGGFAVRWGTNLADSVGAFSLQADRHVNPLAFTYSDDFFFFLGARTGLVANDILVDGNTFSDSPSVPLEHFQNQVAAGALWSRNNWAYVFSLSSSSSRTSISDERENYGAISVTYRH